MSRLTRWFSRAPHVFPRGRRRSGRVFAALMLSPLLIAGTSSAARAANDKIGPVGSGAERWVGGGGPLPYVILFENSPSASAPAQSVTLTDPLDTAVLDPGTLELARLAFGSHQVFPPPHVHAYETDVDLRPEQDLIVRITVSLDAFTGVLHCAFQSIDPSTGAPPTDPMEGFLPPNVTPPEGEGSMQFSVASRVGLATGTQIRNHASIVFDGGPSNLTADWVNTIDADPPESHVLPLPPSEPQSPFTVSWVGQDQGSGIRDFSVFVSEDGGAYRAWRLNTAATSDTFGAGPAGQTYEFFSVARDSVGNVESPPTQPDASTTYLAGVPDSPSDAGAILLWSFPNPSRGGTRIECVMPRAGRVELSIADLHGRDLRILARGYRDAGAWRAAWDGRDGKGVAASPGIYFVRLRVGGAGRPIVVVRKLTLSR